MLLSVIKIVKYIADSFCRNTFGLRTPIKGEKLEFVFLKRINPVSKDNDKQK